MGKCKPISLEGTTMNTLTDSPEDDDLFAEGDESISEVDIGQVMHRPDGYHWLAPDGKQEFGPFETLELALADMELAATDAVEPGESVQEAESELGVADWVDPDTGELAEGQSTPRLHEE
jgi:hypothetical protein